MFIHTAVDNCCRQAKEELATLRKLIELQKEASSENLANGVDAAAQEDLFL